LNGTFVANRYDKEHSNKKPFVFSTGFRYAVDKDSKENEE
jgi:hypothetical protein